MKRVRKRLTYANVMSSIAVFLVLGGATAFAATKLAKNSVGTKQLKNGAVTTKKIKNDAVTGAKVKESSLGEVPSAANASSLGGKAASEYSVRYFARVNGTGTVPTLAAGSPGVTVKEARPFTGAATVVFPVDMTNCAIVATGVSGGPTMYIRQSSISEKNEVVIITANTSDVDTNFDFNVVGVC